MKRKVWKAGKKQAIAAACIVMGTALVACGADRLENEIGKEHINNTIEDSYVVESENFQEESMSSTLHAEADGAEQETVEESPKDLNDILEEGRKNLKKWWTGELIGVWGENSYTQTLLEFGQVKNNGATEFLTFPFEGKDVYDAAIVIAGEKTDEGIKGSIWHVVKEGSANLLEQNVAFSGETLACIQNLKECAVFLNFSRDGIEEGRIIGFEDTTPWELLEDVDGVKHVLPDATIEVIAPITTELGTATVRYRYELEDKNVYQLETQVLEGVEYLASVDVNKLPWAKDAFHTSTISRKSWDNPSIIGEEYIPEAREAEILGGLLPDYSQRWDSWSYDYWAKWDSERHYYQMFQIGETPSFAIYGTCIDSKMIIETYDDSYIQINRYFTSNYGIQPQMLEKDFDQDGDLELAVITLTKHGTGVCIDDIWMADKATDGKWYVYELQAEWYEELNTLFDYQDTEQGLALIIKDEIVSVYSDVSEDAAEKYGVGNHIYYEFVDGKIMLQTLFQVYTEDMSMPIYSGGYLVAELGYLGEGNWSIVDYTYEEDWQE